LFGLAKPPRVLKYSHKFHKFILNSGYSVQNSLKKEIPICSEVRIPAQRRRVYMCKLFEKLTNYNNCHDQLFQYPQKKCNMLINNRTFSARHWSELLIVRTPPID
jgi:hypothetical protein